MVFLQFGLLFPISWELSLDFARNGTGQDCRTSIIDAVMIMHVLCPNRKPMNRMDFCRFHSGSIWYFECCPVSFQHKTVNWPETGIWPQI